MEQLLTVRGVELCVETFGAKTDPAILLIHGASASMDFWETPFCERLAAAGRFVIRYDHRDTGRSVSYPPGKPEYTSADLREDPIGILDALQLERANIVGLSMGGGISQALVLDHPDRVASATFIATSPIATSTPVDLPPMAPHLQEAFAADQPPTDWSDPDAALDAFIQEEQLYAGTFPYDEPARRELVARMIARTTNLASAMTNHWILDDGDSKDRNLADIAVPTLVMHGTEDPMFRPAHAEALAREIPGARLVLLEGAGHELPQQVWDQAIPELVAISRH
ncbi:alpha/beta fold hydrolase [Kribbella monticola]|uniref:alpha/beta fold hydrolase n=1 Tax=Kribbella monticola TaxID=2185285 RepID=UPI001E53D9CD|nr:alpha/beta hydrolase [Kribbella monticola]